MAKMTDWGLTDAGFRRPTYAELLDALEHNGQTYMAFFPAVEEGADEDSDDYGMVILKSITENGEDFLSTLDSDEELDEVYALFMERLFEDEEEGGDGE